MSHASPSSSRSSSNREAGWILPKPCVASEAERAILLIRLQPTRRCNLIRTPGSRLLFLTPHATREGESYIGQNKLTTRNGVLSDDGAA